MTIISKPVIVICCLLLLLSFFTFVILLPISLPVSNNELPAEELVTQYYSNEKLEKLLTTINNVDYGFNYKYETLNDLKFKFKFECARNPQEYNSEFMPYILLFSDNGMKMFLFYDPESLEIVNRIYTDRFLSLNEIKDIVNYGVENKLGSAFLDDSFGKYCSGIGYFSICRFFPVEVKEGTYVLSIWNGNPLKIRNEHFISSDTLFTNNVSESLPKGCDLWPILPIDK